MHAGYGLDVLPARTHNFVGFFGGMSLKMLNFLEDRFKTKKVEIETEIDLTESNDILYSDEQKYNFLSSKYPVIKEMKKNFNLDIE